MQRILYLSSINERNIWVFGAMALAILPITPFVLNSGARGVLFAAGLVSALAILYLRCSLRSPWVIPLIALAFCTSLFSGISVAKLEQAAYPIIFSISLLFIVLGSKESVRVFLGLTSILMLILLVGAVIAFMWGGMGLEPLGSFKNPNGKTNYVFPFSFSNSFYQGVVRPAGIFDEPGAFSFFLCATAFSRLIVGLNKKITWAILFMGLSTLSLAHVVYMVFHFLAEPWRTKGQLVWFSSLFGVFVVVVLSFSGYAGDLERRFFERFDVTEAGVPDGFQRRLENHANTLRSISTASDFFFGSSSPVARYGSAPLTPIVERGFLVVWPHYAVLLFAMLIAVDLVKRKKGVAFALIGFYSLFLQRPGIMATAYSFWAILPFFLLGYVRLVNGPQSIGYKLGERFEYARNRSPKYSRQ